MCDKAVIQNEEVEGNMVCAAESTKHADEIVRNEYGGALETWKIASIKGNRLYWHT